MERVLHASLNLLHLVLELVKHCRINKMYVWFVGMDLPHPFVNRACKDVRCNVLQWESEPGKVRGVVAIWLGVKCPFMLTPQAVHHDNSLASRRGGRDGVDVCGQDDMALMLVTSWSPACVVI